VSAVATRCRRSGCGAVGPVLSSGFCASCADRATKILPAVGSTIELVSMPEEFARLKIGERGKVTRINGPHDLGDGAGPFTQIEVDWECGSRLMLCVPPDEFRVVG
jgi:hypothetical protein